MFKKEYVLWAVIGGSAGYICNDILNAKSKIEVENYLSKSAKFALIFPSLKEAEKTNIKIQENFDANETTILTLKKAIKIDKKEE